MTKMSAIELCAAIRRDCRGGMTMRVFERKYNVLWRTVRATGSGTQPEGGDSGDAKPLARAALGGGFSAQLAEGVAAVGEQTDRDTAQPGGCLRACPMGHVTDDRWNRSGWCGARRSF